MIRTLSLPSFVAAILLWIGPLCVAAQAQVNVDVDVGADIGGAVESGTGAVESGTGAVEGALESVLSEPGTGQGGATALSQDSAIAAVKSKRALPLEQIMTTARLHTRGEIVDARLIAVGGFLLYELKVVEANGDVDELYFYALSGALVQPK
jgi:uncharacterized membrane protein YkoI